MLTWPVESARLKWTTRLKVPLRHCFLFAIKEISYLLNLLYWRISQALNRWEMEQNSDFRTQIQSLDLTFCRRLIPCTSARMDSESLTNSNLKSLYTVHLTSAPYIGRVSVLCCRMLKLRGESTGEILWVDYNNDLLSLSIHALGSVSLLQTPLIRLQASNSLFSCASAKLDLAIILQSDHQRVTMSVSMTTLAASNSLECKFHRHTERVKWVRLTFIRKAESRRNRLEARLWQNTHPVLIDHSSELSGDDYRTQSRQRWTTLNIPHVANVMIVTNIYRKNASRQSNEASGCYSEYKGMFLLDTHACRSLLFSCSQVSRDILMRGVYSRRTKLINLLLQRLPSHSSIFPVII